MRESKLVEIVEILSASEKKAFRQWLASPFFNTRKDVCTLYEQILSGLGAQPDLLKKEQAYRRMYPGMPYDERRINRTMSDLLAQLREYLAWTEWQADPAGPRLLRCRALRRRGLREQFERELEQARAELEAQPWRDEQWYNLQHQLSREQFEFASLQSRRADMPVNAMVDYADTAYRLNRLRYDCSAEILAAISGKKTDPQRFPTPPTDAERLYLHLLEALRAPGRTEAFFEAKSLLETQWSLFREEELRGLYLIALNYCIRKINGGERSFLREAFDLYKSGLANRALFENNTLSRFTFKNALTAGIALGEMDWARRFLEDYKAFLPARERHSAYSFNLAVWYFRLPDYEQAMRILRDTDFGQDPLTNLDARAMLLRIYYEKGFLSALESHIDSFQAYLRRQKDIGYQRENYLNLLRFTRKLLRLPPGADKQALHTEIKNTSAIAERDWLLSKLGVK